MSDVTALTDEDRLRAFARDVLKNTVDIDGADVEDAAMRNGLLEEYIATEPCAAEECWCEIENGFPTPCRRWTAVISRKEPTPCEPR